MTSAHQQHDAHDAHKAHAGSAAPHGIPAGDWQTVQTVAKKYGIDPHVLVAIGVHETGWGTLGAGKQGYYLGVGVPDSGGVQSQYQGLKAQLAGAAQILSKYGVKTIDDLASGALAPHGGQVRYASDPNWTTGVVSAYNQSAGTSFKPSASAAATTTGGRAVTASSTKLTASELAAEYNYAAAFFNLSPELHALLYGPKGALAEQWTPDKFKSALMATHWYRTHTDAQRQWAAMQADDPATAKRQLSTKAEQIRREAVAQGVALSSKELMRIASAAMSYGMTDDELLNAVNSHLAYKRGEHFSGEAGATQDQVLHIAAAYGVPFGEDQVGRTVIRIQNGMQSIQDFQDQALANAKVKYAAFTDQLDQGMTMKDIVDPYVNQMAQTLEMDPTAINWVKDRTIQKALALPGAKPGEPPAAMPLWQFNQTLRQDPRWLQTNNARNDLMDTATHVLSDMGLING